MLVGRETLKAVLYTSPTCAPRKAAKKLLEQLGVEIEERDASRLTTELPGVAAVPVVVIGGEVIIGYSPERIRKAVNGKAPSG